MSTREEIISIGDDLIRDKGFNAFSFADISREMGIKTASIHYHFPTKTDLGLAIIEAQMQRLSEAMADATGNSPLERLKAFLAIYTGIKAEGKICLVGSLASDLHTLDEPMAGKLKELVDAILGWVTDILKEGREKGVFAFSVPPRAKALMVISNMLASLQLTRLTGEKDFNTIKDTLIKELKA